MRAIAVSQTVTLPAQPTVGTVNYIPLGGNGYTAPHAAYSISGFAVTGATGGGAAALRVNLDPRFCSLVGFVFFQNIQATPADAEFRMFIDGGGSPAQVDAGDITSVGTVSAASLNHTWNPTPIVLFGPRAPIIGVDLLNVDADVISMNTMIYLFNINARQATPMGPLLWARGAT